MEACAALDPFSPTRRPDGANAGTQRWRELPFVHWSVPVEESGTHHSPGVEVEVFGPRRV